MSNRALIPLEDAIPEAIRKRSIEITDETRGSGIRIVGGKGSGKSRLVGRLLAFQDFLRGVPQIILDPVGGTANNILDKVSRLPPEHQRQAWKRITWIDMGGEPGLESYVMPMPLLYARHGESFFDQTQRYTNTVLRYDPSLKSASIQGWNAFYQLATATGMLAAAMGIQYTEGSDIIERPERWEGRIRDAVARYPSELTRPAAFLTETIGKSGREKNGLTSSFLTKMRELDWDPHSRAMFGASHGGLDFAAIAANRQTVILDFRNEHDVQQRRFKLLWIFTMIMEYIYSRELDPKQLPCGLVIDELRYLLGDASQHAGAMQEDLEELFNQQMRNKAVWVTVMHQELNQLHPEVRKTLMTCAVQLFGGTSDPDAALTVAKRLHDWDPNAVRKYEPVYSSYEGVSSVIDYRSSEYSIEEQEYLFSRRQLKLPKFTYLVTIAKDEGSQPTSYRTMSVSPLDDGQYPDLRTVNQIRKLLMKRDGREVRTILADIEARYATSSPSMGSSVGEAPLPVSERRVPRRSRE